MRFQSAEMLCLDSDGMSVVPSNTATYDEQQPGDPVLPQHQTESQHYTPAAMNENECYQSNCKLYRLAILRCTYYSNCLYQESINTCISNSLNRNSL